MSEALSRALIASPPNSTISSRSHPTFTPRAFVAAPSNALNSQGLNATRARSANTCRQRTPQMKPIKFLLLASLLLLYPTTMSHAQKRTPPNRTATPAALRRMADEYYRRRNENYPVVSSDQGLHTWDRRLTDYAPAAISARHQHVAQLLAQVRAMRTEGWQKDDRIDWLLFRAQLEGVEFGDRVLQFEQTNPQTYVDECTNAIFSLLKKEYD